jgi:hypothetical protein
MTDSVRPLRRALASAAVLGLLLQANLQAQLGAPSGGARVQPAPADVLEALGVAEATIQRLDVPSAAGSPFQFVVALDGVDRVVMADPHSMLSADFRLLVQQADGSIVEQPSAPEVTYRGLLPELAGSVVAGSLEPSGFRGILRTAPGAPLFAIQPLAELVPWGAPGEHVVFCEGDNLPGDWTCGLETDVRLEPVPGGGTASGGARSDTIDRICEIACDADVEFYNKNGSSVTTTQNDITTVINGMDAIYASDVQVRYTITTILVRTSEPDPYSTSSPSSLLSQFTSEWLANQSAIVRDVAHLFTGKNLSGSVIGIANLGGICSIGSGYGLSESRFTGNLTSRIALTAHELGHNWTAGHCNGQPDCKIMCSSLGGCGALTSFGSSSQAVIHARRDQAQCLDYPPPTAPPTLTSITPTTSPAFRPATITLTGTGFFTATSIDVGGTQLTQPLGFRPATDTLVNLTLDAPAIGSLPVTVSNALGTSAAQTLTYTETIPPKLVAPQYAIGTLNFDWDVGARSGDLFFLLLDLTDGSTVPFQSELVLGGGFLFASGVCDSVGVGQHQIVVPLGLRGMSFWSQVLTYDPVTLGLDDATNIVSSVVFF